MNYYKLGVLNDRSNINVRAQASTSSVTYYNTRGSDKQLINQTVTVTNEKNNFYETIAWYPIVNGTVLTSHNKGNYTMDLNSNPGFIAKELITIVNNGKYNPQTPPVIGPDQPVDEVKPLENAKLYEVLATAGLRVRSAPSTSSAQLGLLAFQEQVEGVLQDGWIKIIHNEQYGYISAEFAKLVEELQPEPPVVEETNQTYMVNATGLRVRSEPNTSATVLGTLEYQSLVTGVVKDGWLKFTYNGKTAYTFAQYLKIVDTSSLTIDELIKSVGSVVDSNILTGIKMNTSVEALTKAIKSKDANVIVSVVGKDDKIKTGPVLTGDKLTVKSGAESKTVTIAIKGDVDGNGTIATLDYVRVIRDMQGYITLEGAYRVAADVNSDG
ncbi:MAG: SH3 domain-containing protein, partial [Erysipelothrix sp.]|nr:SH3 domain-containing protein [Erysipelothrix sp.]